MDRRSTHAQSIAMCGVCSDARVADTLSDFLRLCRDGSASTILPWTAPMTRLKLRANSCKSTLSVRLAARARHFPATSFAKF